VPSETNNSLSLALVRNLLLERSFATVVTDGREPSQSEFKSCESPGLVSYDGSSDAPDIIRVE
jgi:hypothetical protein